MDLFKQLRAFYDQLDLNPLSSSEIALWHALTFYNNKLQASEFTIAASVLCAKSGLKERNFFKARNALAQNGLITWKSRNGNQSAIYHMKVLYERLPANNAHSSTDNRSGSSADSSTRSRSTLTTITRTPTVTVTKENKSPKRKRRVYADDSQELILSKKLFERIKEYNPEALKPNFQKWADDIRLMHERDGREFENISDMIDRCQDDDFWHINILSAKKLREKYDTMKAQFSTPEAIARYEVERDIKEQQHKAQLKNRLKQLNEEVYQNPTPELLDKITAIEKELGINQALWE